MACLNNNRRSYQILYNDQSFYKNRIQQQKMKKTDPKQSLIISYLDQLRSEESKKRINSLNHLKTIAQVIGSDRTRTQLIPFLNEFIEDEDEVNIVLISQLKDFSSYIGGEQYERILLPLLIGLCKSDSRANSEAAIDIIKGILKKVDTRRNEDILVETVKKLVESDYFLSKEAAINILTTFLLDVNNPSFFLSLFVQFAESQDYRQRKIAVKNLKNLINHEPHNSGVTKIIANFIRDREDIIKILAIDGIVEYLQKDKTFVLECFKELLKANSWRINMRICQVLESVSGMISKEQFRDYFQDSYLGFLKHSQPELRIAACICLGRACLMMDPDDINKVLVPLIIRLAEDPNQLIKIEIAKRFLSVSSFLKPEEFQKSMIPILSQFLKNPNPEINLGVFSSLAFLEQSIPNSQLQDITLTCVNQLFTSASWRTKCQAVDIMKQLIKYPIFVNDRTISMIVSWIFDKIDAVRKKTLDLIELLFKENSPHWAETKLIPRLVPIQNSSNYLQRQLILLIIERVIRYVPVQHVNNYFLPILQTMSKDKVPNIRYMVTKVIKGAQLANNVKCRMLVETLSDDRDLEVRSEAREII